jgi:YtkA-like
VGPATLTLQVADASQKPIAHAIIDVEADMAHPGMAPVFGQVEETTPGNYRAHVNFTMAGDWVVLLHIQLPDGRRIERQVDVRGVQPD